MKNPRLNVFTKWFFLILFSSLVFNPYVFQLGTTDSNITFVEINEHNETGTKKGKKSITDIDEIIERSSNHWLILKNLEESERIAINSTLESDFIRQIIVPPPDLS